jgi:hypothetical protein
MSNLIVEFDPFDTTASSSSLNAVSLWHPCLVLIPTHAHFFLFLVLLHASKAIPWACAPILPSVRNPLFSTANHMSSLALTYVCMGLPCCCSCLLAPGLFLGSFLSLHASVLHLSHVFFFLVTCLSLQMLPLPAHFLFRILFAHCLSTCLCMSGAASKLYGCISPCCATIFLLSCTVSVPLLGLLSCSCLSVRLLCPVPPGCTCFVLVVPSVWLLRPLSLRKLVDTVVTKPQREEA